MTLFHFTVSPKYIRPHTILKVKKVLFANISKQHFPFIYLPVQQNFTGHSDYFCYPKWALNVKMLHLKNSKAWCWLLVMHTACWDSMAACQTVLLECCTKPCSLNRNRLQHEVTPDNKLPNQHLKAFLTCCSQIF